MAFFGPSQEEFDFLVKRMRLLEKRVLELELTGARVERIEALEKEVTRLMQMVR